MADYIVQAGDSAIEPYATTPGQVDTITFTDNVGRAQLVSDGGSEVRVTINGTDPAFLPAGASTPSFRLPTGVTAIIDFPMTSYPDVIKILSSGSAMVSVQVLV